MRLSVAKEISEYFSLGHPGYIMDFTSNQWEEFTYSIVGVELIKEFGGSKGTSFVRFLTSDSDEDYLKYKLIFELNEAMKDYNIVMKGKNSQYVEPKINPIVKNVLLKASECSYDRILTDTTFNNKITLAYIQNLPSRIEKDMTLLNFDSVLTKSSTMIDEVFKYILENTDGEAITIKYIESKKLRKIVFSRLNMDVKSDSDKRVKQLLSSLNNITDSILEMRNKQGDAHAQGSNRIAITKDEAMLVANTTMIFCEYLFGIYQRNKDNS
ncbi:abortive infection family protein [Listeria monocytogenes]|nr:abortive infection family protein [Listeria monocytogenes]EGC2922546.1 abortive infection family protein [Listeria monocytogenes]EGC2934695.1 abortive infection family protein [Listeria monocytogenes]EGC2983878.1 abortive infection family protein [Listeria monocytogenes]